MTLPLSHPPAVPGAGNGVHHTFLLILSAGRSALGGGMGWLLILIVGLAGLQLAVAQEIHAVRKGLAVGKRLEC